MTLITFSFVLSVKTEATSNGALSRLYIANANRNDSGNYTCSLADVAASAVSVHVLRGEGPSLLVNLLNIYLADNLDYDRWVLVMYVLE